jgi:hypothetical protein
MLGRQQLTTMNHTPGDCPDPRHRQPPATPNRTAAWLLVALAAATLSAALLSAQSSGQPESETWVFDRLENIGGHPTKVLGNPRVVETPIGKAVEFDGVDDALFIETHPLAGAQAWTWEVIFRPDAGGRPEQRFFHLQERDPATGADTNNRLLFETRLTNGSWYLDSFALSGSASKALINPGRQHPLGSWYHAAAVYDGAEFRNYVNGVLENSAEIRLAPHGQGHSSVGVRINLRDYFKGAVRKARMTRRALPVSEFLPVVE